MVHAYSAFSGVSVVFLDLRLRYVAERDRSFQD